jgi:hypothetical protein
MSVWSTGASPPTASRVHDCARLPVGSEVIIAEGVTVRGNSCLPCPGRASEKCRLSHEKTSGEVLEAVARESGVHICGADAEQVRRYICAVGAEGIACRRIAAIHDVVREGRSLVGRLTAKHRQTDVATFDNVAVNDLRSVGCVDPDPVAVLHATTHRIAADKVGRAARTTVIVRVDSTRRASHNVVDESRSLGPVGANRIVGLAHLVPRDHPRSAAVEYCDGTRTALHIGDCVLVESEGLAKVGANGLNAAQIDVAHRHVRDYEVGERTLCPVIDDAVSSIDVGAADDDSTYERRVITFQHHVLDGDIVSLYQDHVADYARRPAEGSTTTYTVCWIGFRNGWIDHCGIARSNETDGLADRKVFGVVTGADLHRATWSSSVDRGLDTREGAARCTHRKRRIRTRGCRDSEYSRCYY